MKRLYAPVVVALWAIGCSHGPVNILVTVTPSSSSSSPAPANSIETNQPAAYPEKPKVDRLLTRARDIEQSGQFTNALSIVNQALAIDPHSPSATALKNRLEEIIRRSE
jgi:hypothetical protein